MKYSMKAILIAVILLLLSDISATTYTALSGSVSDQLYTTHSFFSCGINVPDAEGLKITITSNLSNYNCSSGSAYLVSNIHNYHNGGNYNEGCYPEIANPSCSETYTETFIAPNNVLISIELYYGGPYISGSFNLSYEAVSSSEKVISSSSDWLFDADSDNFYLGKNIRTSASPYLDKANPVLIVNSSGFLGIGTNSPDQKIHVNDGQIHLSTTVANQQQTGTIRMTELTNSFLGAYLNYEGAANFFHIGVHNTNDKNTANDRNAISIRRSDGNVGIGVTNIYDYKLAVNGTIGAKELKITDPLTADFVFEDDYDLRSLSDVAAFVKENKHLPEVPSAKEMQENGVGVAKMNQLLLQKVEELTLYLIEQEKRINELECKAQ